ncbi:MAG: FKBP-type peptidyl-prolyl cis-trans isomerase [Rhodocyclaceae bacterium]|nr:FKBP-type peptidyl-prolyl cis-trans isomerase [Rhodocyclaceae bacterium]
MQTIVQADSLVTLNFRIALKNGTPIISTFESTPATLKLGSGELSANLERCLTGITVGSRHVFPLDAEQAFGVRRQELMEKVPVSDLPEGVEVGTLVEFTTDDGGKHAGLVGEITEGLALVDFNHPLAGHKITFEVEVIGIL